MTIMANTLSDVEKRFLLILRNALQNHLEILKQGDSDFDFKADSVVEAFREEIAKTTEILTKVEEALEKFKRPKSWQG